MVIGVDGGRIENWAIGVHVHYRQSLVQAALGIHDIKAILHFAGGPPGRLAESNKLTGKPKIVSVE